MAQSLSHPPPTLLFFSLLNRPPTFLNSIVGRCTAGAKLWGGIRRCGGTGHPCVHVRERTYAHSYSLPLVLMQLCHFGGKCLMREKGQGGIKKRGKDPMCAIATGSIPPPCHIPPIWKCPQSSPSLPMAHSHHQLTGTACCF